MALTGALGPTYGVRCLVLTEINIDGSAKTGGKTVKITTPQQASYDPQVIEGQKTELRGGDGLIATIQEADILDSVNVNLQDGKLNWVAMALLGGGTLTGTEPNYTGWKPWTTTQQKTNPQPHFKAEIYQAEYGDGSQTADGQLGYIKITLANCTGRIPTFSQQDRTFSVPSYQIRARENTSTSEPCITFDRAASLPA